MKRHRWFNVIAFNSNKIKKMLENKIHHPYIEKYIELPFIDLDKIGTLLYIFDEVDIVTQRKYEYIISVMLVQIALDTHDLVSIESYSPTDDLKRQLHVLAGDYYSGMYYKSLADLGEIPLINALANAIKNINEEKMVLYKNEVTNWQELIEVIQNIESLLYTSVAELYQLSEENVELIRSVLLINRLAKEITLIEDGTFSFIEQHVEQNIVEPPYSSLTYSLEIEIERNKDKIHSMMKRNEYSYHQLINYIFGKKMLSAVEEG